VKELWKSARAMCETGNKPILNRKTIKPTAGRVNRG